MRALEASFLAGALKGKSALVIGGGSIGPGWGNGKAAAVGYARAGASVVVVDLHESGARETADITNISSIAAVRFLKKPMVAYTAAKAGLEALTRACAAAYGRDNIRVNCIRVGFAETPLLEAGMSLRQLTDEQKQAEMAKSRAMVPLRGEHGSAFDVANAAVFLASDQAAYLSGVILNVDGALECAPL